MHEHDPNDPSGERFVPETMGGELIEAEHQARYRFALSAIAGKRVLDAGCGVGWGSKLLHQAGAASVVGLDISSGALADCRRRAPECTFVEGDIEALPFADGEFDVVVCFEALEHTHDTGKALEQLVRVLHPDGVLFVSSPNPEVYPSGNPFHIHELTPAELQSEVAARLPQQRLYRQHQALVSLLHQGTTSGEVDPFASMVWPVSGLAPGDDPYAVVVASRDALPELSSWACLAPFTQLQNLLDERASLMEQLHESQAAVRRSEAALHAVVRERDDARAAATSHHTQWEAARVQLENQRAMAARAAAERDTLSMRLLDVQRELAGLPAPGQKRAVHQVHKLRRRSRQLKRELKRARIRRSRLETELAELRTSASWRVTRPLRWASRLSGAR